VKNWPALWIVAGCLAFGTAGAGGLTLTSSDMGGQLTEAQVFSGFGCTGQNRSPALAWTGAPAGTRSFAVTLFDPDAPTGSGWWHWLIFNIDAGTHALKTDAGNPDKNLAPAGSVQSMTDFGSNGFGGACPPKGAQPHRYVFTVYALDTEHLDLDENSPPAMVGFNLNRHALAKASLVAYYSR